MFYLLRIKLPSPHHLFHPPRFAHAALALLMILSRLNHVGRLSSAAPATIAWCVLDSLRTQAGLKLGVTEEPWVLLGLPVAGAHVKCCSRVAADTLTQRAIQRLRTPVERPPIGAHVTTKRHVRSNRGRQTH